jgi:parallel beta helix pectate lyase-like protein
MAILALFLASSANTATLVVNHLGGGTHTSLAAAFSTVSPGDTIQLDAAANPFPSEGSLSTGISNLTITSINGQALLPQTNLILSGDNVTIDNIHLDGENITKVLIRATVLVDGLVIRNCKLVNPASGTTNSSLADDLIDMSEALDSGAAIRLDSCQNILIENNDMQSADNSAIQNQVCIFCTEQSGTPSNLTIRNNMFKSEFRNISIWQGWSNVLVEGNTFVRTSQGQAQAGAAFLVSTEYSVAGAVSSNHIIRDNTFTYSDDASIAYVQTIIDNVLIENNNFIRAVGFGILRIESGGQGLVVRNNTIDTVASAAVMLANAVSLPAADAIRNVIIADNQFINPARAADLLVDINQNIVFENNVFETFTSNVGIRPTHWNSAAIIRNNQFLQGGSSSIMSIEGSGSVIVDNELQHAVRGISFIAEVPGTSLGGVAGGNIAMRNLLIDCGGSGTGSYFAIGDYHYSATVFLPPVGNTIVGNTIVLTAGNGIDFEGTNYTIYNNLVAYNNGIGINMKAGGSVALSDFNLLHGNGGGNYGGLSQGTNDVLSDPMFAFFIGVPTGADFHLQQASPARNAGSPNGTDPDYVTELGYYQDFETNTSVSASCWEMYK